MQVRLSTVIAMCLVALLTAFPARAQDDVASASFITPFPENDTYRMLVIGDSLAMGMVDGLVEAFGSADSVQMPRRHRALNGLARAEFDEEIKSLEDPNWREPLHIAVVLTGVWDRAPLRNAAGRRIAVGSPEWRDLYVQRVDRVMKALKRKKAAVYWVSVPVTRRPDWNRDIELINEVHRERAFLNGFKYVDAYAGFVDETGGFNAYGPDLTGKMRLLREGDGVHFTQAGNRKLSHFVERLVRRDLTQAKAERTIPLLGSEAEQRRISPEKAAAAAPAAASTKAKGQQRSVVQAQTAAVAGPTDGDQKADNSRIQLRIVGAQGREEMLTVDLPRPAIPASVMAVITRRESAERPSQLGDTLTDEISGGLLVMTSVTPSAEAGGRRRIAPTQAPFFRVLVKGERVAPKPGRVDDFSWPKPELSAEAPQAGQPATEARPVRKGLRGG